MLDRREFVGQISGKNMKDYGKGKDAAPSRVLVATAKFDATPEGFRGSVDFPIASDGDCTFGQVVHVTIEIRQQEMALEEAETAATGAR